MPKFALCFFGVCVAALLIALFDLSIYIALPIVLFGIILALVFIRWRSCRIGLQV
jgi:Flp pilus assembly protein TadB